MHPRARKHNMTITDGLMLIDGQKSQSPLKGELKAEVLPSNIRRALNIPAVRCDHICGSLCGQTSSSLMVGINSASTCYKAYSVTEDATGEVRHSSAIRAPRYDCRTINLDPSWRLRL